MVRHLMKIARSYLRNIQTVTDRLVFLTKRFESGDSSVLPEIMEITGEILDSSTPPIARQEVLNFREKLLSGEDLEQAAFYLQRRLRAVVQRQATTRVTTMRRKANPIVVACRHACQQGKPCQCGGACKQKGVDVNIERVEVDGDVEIEYENRDSPDSFDIGTLDIDGDVEMEVKGPSQPLRLRPDYGRMASRIASNWLIGE